LVQRAGFALRQGVFSPREIGEAADVIEKTRNISDIFVPDGRSGYEAIEIASSILSRTARVRAGTGVIRLLEHDLVLLTRRIQTLQGFYSNRFVLGVGTGTPAPQPGMSLMATVQKIEELKKSFQSFPSGVHSPQVYIAALRSGIAKRSIGKVDGLLLNFCSPSHAARLIESLKGQMAAPIEFACYLKTFYSSENDETAQRLLVQEFLNYDSAPQYHEMFIQDGTAGAISKFQKNDEWRNRSFETPRELLSVSLANPSEKDLHDHLGRFRRAGITLPVIYPYFPNDEKSEFKLEMVKRILKST
jgi:hypothetical protein